MQFVHLIRQDADDDENPRSFVDSVRFEAPLVRPSIDDEIHEIISLIDMQYLASDEEGLNPALKDDLSISTKTTLRIFRRAARGQVRRCGGWTCSSQS
jgi:hypothetical protein